MENIEEEEEEKEQEKGKEKENKNNNMELLGGGEIKKVEMENRWLESGLYVGKAYNILSRNNTRIKPYNQIVSEC